MQTVQREVRNDGLVYGLRLKAKHWYSPNHWSRAGSEDAFTVSRHSLTGVVSKIARSHQTIDGQCRDALHYSIQCIPTSVAWRIVLGGQSSMRADVFVSQTESRSVEISVVKHGMSSALHAGTTPVKKREKYS